jgi:hypothetical protein
MLTVQLVSGPSPNHTIRSGYGLPPNIHSRATLRSQYVKREQSKVKSLQALRDWKREESERTYCEFRP